MYVCVYLYIYIYICVCVYFLSVSLSYYMKMHAPKNRNSPGTLLEPFAVGLQSWANKIFIREDGHSNSRIKEF